MSRELVFKIRGVKIRNIARFFFLFFNRKGLKFVDIYIHFPEINKLCILLWLSHLCGFKVFALSCLLLLFWVPQLFDVSINMYIYIYGFKVIGKFYCCDICDVYDYEYYYYSFLFDRMHFVIFSCSSCVMLYVVNGIIQRRLGGVSSPFYLQIWCLVCHMRLF